jgi:hypothetical protein
MTIVVVHILVTCRQAELQNHLGAHSSRKVFHSNLGLVMVPSRCCADGTCAQNILNYLHTSLDL